MRFQSFDYPLSAIQYPLPAICALRPCFSFPLLAGDECFFPNTSLVRAREKVVVHDVPRPKCPGNPRGSVKKEKEGDMAPFASSRPNVVKITRMALAISAPPAPEYCQSLPISRVYPRTHSVPTGGAPDHQPTPGADGHLAQSHGNPLRRLRIRRYRF